MAFFTKQKLSSLKTILAANVFAKLTFPGRSVTGGIIFDFVSPFMIKILTERNVKLLEVFDEALLTATPALIARALYAYYGVLDSKTLYSSTAFYAGAAGQALALLLLTLLKLHKKMQNNLPKCNLKVEEFRLLLEASYPSLRIHFSVKLNYKLDFIKLF